MISINEVIHVKAKVYEGIGAPGIFTYVVDPSNCVPSDIQRWNTLYQISESTRLINYLQSLGDGNRNLITCCLLQLRRDNTIQCSLLSVTGREIIK